MKTIEVSDEDYDFLKECVNLLHTQDTRSTRNPIYTIHKQQKVYGIDEDYTTDYVYVTDDGVEFDSLESIFDWLVDNGYDDELLDFYNEHSEDTLEELTEKNKDEVKEFFVDEFDTADWLADKLDIRLVYYRVEEQQETDGTCFSFFEKDAFEHLEMNRHNIHGEKIYTYADSLFRSPRMEKLLEFLKELKL